MDLDALRHGNFSQLGEAITDWEEMTKKLATLKEDAQKNLKGKADRASWNGVNAQVSREFIDKTAQEFADAHTQADTITNILKDTRGELVGYHTQLTEAISRGDKKNLTVIDTGHGTFSVTGNTRPDWASDPSGKTSATNQQDVDDLRDEIQRILSKATESDNSAAKVLRLLVDQTKYGFSDAAYKDRDTAADAVEAADKLAKMAKHPDKMSAKDIAEFNRYLEKYHNDPLFSERFAEGLGGKGTIQFWTDMVDAHAGARGSELKSMEELQKNLSMTLATASFSDSDAMKAWKSDLLKEMNTSFHPDSKVPSQLNPVGALGSQVISSLMRQGEFDTEFLDDYRTRLFKQDRGAGDSDTDALWVKGYDHIDLVFGSGNGRDPLDGLFDALSHNPEAATHAFESKADLDHMLNTTRYTDRGASLGHALEAAVTGLGAGELNSTPPHSSTQVKIMANIMAAVADPDNGGSLVTKAMGASFGHMAAAYMPEISRELGGPNSEKVFLTTSDSPAGLDKTDVVRFLTQVSNDAGGRAAIRYGESIYTDSLLEAHMADPSLFHGSQTQVIHDIAYNSGMIEGIVGRAVADSDVASSVEMEKQENDAMAQQGEFFKAVLAGGVGMGAVALCPEGKFAEMGAGAGGGFFGQVASIAVDAMYDGKQQEGALDSSLYRTGKDLNAMQDSVNQQAQWAVQEAMKKHHSTLPADGTLDLVRNAANDGWRDSDGIMEDVEKRPSA
ncbi:hypothetical protein ACIHEJ_26770 [Streptomyces sp. NPDC052301]|uniref:hypothetical protein n=1 Tax=Streptomyces sp. NPDC052301 TaxID=3365687 RepID=UPI0037D1AD71